MLQRGGDNNSEKSSSFWIRRMQAERYSNNARWLCRLGDRLAAVLVRASILFFSRCPLIAHQLESCLVSGACVIESSRTGLAWKEESESESQLSAEKRVQLRKDVSLFGELHYYSPELLVICLLAV